jgi:hypothetical protein
LAPTDAGDDAVTLPRDTAEALGAQRNDIVRYVPLRPAARYTASGNVND